VFRAQGRSGFKEPLIYVKAANAGKQRKPSEASRIRETGQNFDLSRSCRGKKKTYEVGAGRGEDGRFRTSLEDSNRCQETLPVSKDEVNEKIKKGIGRKGGWRRKTK